MDRTLSLWEKSICRVGGSSDLQPVLSGVSQGSVLGPILFIFYINDITSVQLMDGTMSLYADDIMLYRPEGQTI